MKDEIIINKLEDKEDIDELVNMIDNLMANGGGHVNITADENSSGMTVETVKANTCANGACMQPTELKVDEE